MKEVRFKATGSFYSPSLKSHYVEGQTYRVRAADDTLARLVDEWLACGSKSDPEGNNKIEIIHWLGATVSGHDQPAPTLWQKVRDFFGMNAMALYCLMFLGAWAVTHPTAVRTAIADLVVDRLDAGAGAGTLEFQTAGSVEVATLTFSDPAFGAAASGTATASAITSDTNATGGTITKFVAQDSDGTDVFLGSCTATGGGGDITLSSVVISAGQTVAVTSLTYSAPA